MTEEESKTVTVQEYNDLQIESVKQHLFVMNTLIQKVVALEKVVEELKGSS